MTSRKSRLGLVKLLEVHVGQVEGFEVSHGLYPIDLVSHMNLAGRGMGQRGGLNASHLIFLFFTLTYAA